MEREHPRSPEEHDRLPPLRLLGGGPRAAGIRPIWPARPPGTVAERVAAARRLERDGLGVPAISDALEVRPDTVRRYLKAHPCRSCGDPVVGDARLCHVCATRRANPKRDPRGGDRGRPHLGQPRRPTADDRRLASGPLRWLAPLGGGVRRLAADQRRADRLRWLGPDAQSCRVGANKPSWEPETILAALRAYDEEFGRPPAKQDLEWPRAGFPSARTVRRHFGSFTGGLEAAGLQPRGARRWDTEAILAASASSVARSTVGPGPRTGRRLARTGPRRTPSTTVSAVGRRRSPGQLEATTGLSQTPDLRNARVASTMGEITALAEAGYDCQVASSAEDSRWQSWAASTTPLRIPGSRTSSISILSSGAASNSSLSPSTKLMSSRGASFFRSRVRTRLRTAHRMRGRAVRSVSPACVGASAARRVVRVR